MQAWKINPYDQTISPIETDGEFVSFYEFMSTDKHKVTMITAVGIDTGNVMYVDEEGLFKKNKCYFVMSGSPTPYCGIGIIIGRTKKGEHITSLYNHREVQAIIGFPS